MLEIGSEFHWDAGSISAQETEYFDGWTLLRSGRDCLRAVAMMQKPYCHTVLFPELCCQSMVDPFVQQGYETLFYPLKADLTGDLSVYANVLSRPCIVLSLSYFGTVTLPTEQIAALRRQYPQTFFLLDCTQTLVPSEDAETVYDAIVTSVRKWLALPSGGALFLRKSAELPPVHTDFRFAQLRRSAMEKKTHYLETGNTSEKEAFRAMLGTAVALIDTDAALVRIDEESRCRVARLDVTALMQRREENAAVLRAGIVSISTLEQIETLPERGGELYFPILSQHRDALQQALARCGVYCPVIWPCPKQCVAPHQMAQRIAAQMLALPCDQRYTPEDMALILQVLERVEKELSR